MQNDVERKILTKMFADRRICTRHISLQNLKTGFPSHVKGDVENGIKKLVKQNLILSHPTSYGMQFALNPKRIDEIIKRISIG